MSGLTRANPDTLYLSGENPCSLVAGTAHNGVVPGQCGEASGQDLGDGAMGVEFLLH